MSANTVVNVTAGDWDTKASVLMPAFQQTNAEGNAEYKAGPYWSCESIVWSVGPEPSVALCKIPLRDVDDTAPSVAAVNTSPAASIKMLTSGIVLNKIVDRSTDGTQTLGAETTVFRGIVTKISHEFAPKTDFANVRLEDKRWLLKRLPIIGRWERVDNNSESEAYSVYRQGWPAWPNQYGQPNAIYDKSRKCFVFCSPRLGLNADESPPEPVNLSQTKATWWTDAMVIDYLLMSINEYPSVTGGSKPPYSIIQDGIATKLIDAQRKVVPITDILKDCKAHAKSANLDGRNIADVFSDLCKHAGSFDITMFFNGESSQLAIVPTKYGYADNGITLNRAGTGEGRNIADAKVVVGGDLSEDADQFYSKVTVAGALVFVENRVTSDPASTGLKPAWSAATSGAALAFMNSLLAAGDTEKDALKKTFSKYPDWLAAWRISPDYSFMSGVSDLTGFSTASVSRPIADRILTSYIAGSNTDTSETSDRTQYRRPILFEYRNSGGDPWILATAGDGLQIDANGVIRLPGLREASDGTAASYQSFYVEYKSPLTDGVEKITGKQLRATVAIPCDHRVWQSYQHPSRKEAGITVPDEVFDADRVESGATGGHAYLIGGDPDIDGEGTFRREYRNNGWPIPESVEATNAFSDGSIWSDAGALDNAAKRQMTKLARLHRGGTLIVPHLSAAYQVGQMIRDLSYDGGVYPIRAVITKVTWSNSPGAQRTVLGFDT